MRPGGQTPPRSTKRHAAGQKERRRLRAGSRGVRATQAQRKPALSEQRDDQRELQRRANRVAARVRAIDDLDKLNSARTSLERARGIAQAVADLKTYQVRNPVPDKKKLDELKTNRDKILQLQADLNAASMILRVMPIEGAGAAQLALDGECA